MTILYKERTIKEFLNKTVTSSSGDIIKRAQTTVTDRIISHVVRSNSRTSRFSPAFACFHLDASSTFFSAVVAATLSLSPNVKARMNQQTNTATDTLM